MPARHSLKQTKHYSAPLQSGNVWENEKSKNLGRGETETQNMKTKQIKLPGPDHPISIQRNPARVVVSVEGRVVADTRNALTLREADYPAVQYIPRADVDFSRLERTDHATYCPYKGDCNYYSVPGGGKKSVNAVWTYENPYPAVAQIKEYVAFYPDRVDEIKEQLATTVIRS